MTTYIVDPDDSCRPCHGRGWITDSAGQTGAGYTITERCDHCGGSGKRSVRITNPEGKQHAENNV